MKWPGKERSWRNSIGLSNKESNLVCAQPAVPVLHSFHLTHFSSIRVIFWRLHKVDHCLSWSYFFGWKAKVKAIVTQLLTFSISTGKQADRITRTSKQIDSLEKRKQNYETYISWQPLRIWNANHRGWDYHLHHCKVSWYSVPGNHDNGSNSCFLRVQVSGHYLLKLEHCDLHSTAKGYRTWTILSIIILLMKTILGISHDLTNTLSTPDYWLLLYGVVLVVLLMPSEQLTELVYPNFLTL